MKKIIIIGGTGNGTIALSTIVDINKNKKEWEVLGFFNDFEKNNINGFPVIGKIDKESADKYVNDKDVYFIYTMISSKYNYRFLNRLHDLEIPDNRFAKLIHPTAVVSEHSQLGWGISIQPFVSVGPNVKIGNHVQIFGQALIGHNSVLDNYSYVAAQACIGANVHLQEGAFMGQNCSSIENITIGKWGLVGMGSAVISDVPDFAKIVGNPGRIIGSTK